MPSFLHNSFLNSADADVLCQAQWSLLIGRLHRENCSTNKELIFVKKWKQGTAEMFHYAH